MMTTDHSSPSSSTRSDSLTGPLDRLACGSALCALLLLTVALLALGLSSNPRSSESVALGATSLGIETSAQEAP
ncbi:MAG: hypothetical protein LBM75_02625 [Myxococcales bacterium]|jgi:hypothetical protein|nr:hypothetical protein [Myxococcales bacterium]